LSGWLGRSAPCGTGFADQEKIDGFADSWLTPSNLDRPLARPDGEVEAFAALRSIGG
jgi:hypothetical protein